MQNCFGVIAVSKKFKVGNMFIKSCMHAVMRWFSGLAAPVSDTGSPLPQTQHLALSVGQLRKRLLIVSDVHGCFDELERLLHKVEFTPESMTVLFVGDLVAKGPKSLEVIRFLMKQKSMLAVRGNHEDNVLRAYYEPETSKYKKRKIYDFINEMTHEEIKFIQELPISISVPGMGLLIVHAGLDPNKRGMHVQHQAFSDLIRIRCVRPDGSTTKDHPDESKNQKLWGPLYVGPPFVVYGHDAKRKLQFHPWARGIDTGCCYGGSLTGILIEDTADVHNWMKTMQLVSVQAARVYANPDKDD